MPSIVVLIAAAGFILSKPPPSILTAATEIHFQRADEQGISHVLTEREVPLRTGDRIQIHVRLDRPAYLCIIAIDPKCSVSVLFPVPDSQPDRHNNLQLPPAADQWYPLKDPPGTETIVLAAHTEPIQPEQIVAAIQTALAPTGRPPSLQPTCLAILQPKAVQFLFDHSRTLDLDEPVKSDPGALQQLVRALAQKWSAVSGVTFPHVFAKQENPQ